MGFLIKNPTEWREQCRKWNKKLGRKPIKGKGSVIMTRPIGRIGGRAYCKWERELDILTNQ